MFHCFKNSYKIKMTFIIFMCNIYHKLEKISIAIIILKIAQLLFYSINMSSADIGNY